MKSARDDGAETPRRDLQSLLQDLDQAISSAPAADLPAIIVALNMRIGTAAARAMNRQGQTEPVTSAPDANLLVKEAAQRLGVSAAWLYKNSERLPFAVRIGRRLLFSAGGLERWNRHRQGRGVARGVDVGV